MSEKELRTGEPEEADPSEGEEWHDERELTTTATPEQLYRAWADPEILSQWFPDEARGSATPGDELVHVWTSMGGMEITHRVLEAIPNERLLLEATAPSGIPFRQEILIERRGGETVLRLVHSGFSDDADWDDELEGIDSGWQMALAILSLYLERYFGRPRRTVLSLRPVAQSPRELGARHRQADWLGSGGPLPRAGALFELNLPGEISLHGKVLVDSGTEIALTCPDLDGVLELKAFAVPTGGAMVGYRLSSWHADVDGFERLHQALDRALDRLAA